MKLFFLTQLMICFVYLPNVSAQGACNTQSSGGTCAKVAIEEIYIEDDGTNVYIRTTGDESSLSSKCGTSTDETVILDASKSNFNQIYSAMLTSVTTGIPITLRLMPVGGACHISYIRFPAK